jgi:hypothetical protein
MKETDAAKFVEFGPEIWRVLNEREQSRVRHLPKQK